MNKSHRFLLVLWCLCGVNARAQSVTQPDSLLQTIQSLDAKLFEANNRCDLTTLGVMVSDNLEFYHDQTGLSVGKAPFLAAIKQNICGKVKRELLGQTLEVYPLEFVILWRKKDGAWQVTRTISYHHNQGLLAK